MPNSRILLKRYYYVNTLELPFLCYWIDVECVLQDVCIEITLLVTLDHVVIAY